ncbi:MAG: hypothetical protein Q9223_002061 [Gallowayella weberi]
MQGGLRAAPTPDKAKAENKLLRNVSNASSRGSFLERRLSILTTGRSTGEPADEVRGSLGLTLLHEPSEPIVDFVFEWLPTEPGFKRVRIHTYGYNSDWGEKKGSVLNIHDFGSALLGAMNTSPHIRDSASNPIVFVGHSMGGLVIKKAYILARHDPNFKDLASRFHSTYFLATPHRGADSAQLLNRVIKASMTFSTKDYINDLIPNSGAIQAINDDFRHLAQDLRLWSFYESVKTNLGVSHALIVEKDSAILGLPEERVQLLNADHRHVCKFKDPLDNNYITIRNALVTTVDQIEKEWLVSTRDDYNNTMKALAGYLGQSDTPDNDLVNLLDRQMEGTCQWFTNDAEYKSWRAGVEHVPKLLWLSGKPATGKSTLAAHVVKQFYDANIDCGCFFFRHGDKSKISVASMLRSLAYQMALTNPLIRSEILAMHDNGVLLDGNDERSLWRSIYLSRIFRTNFHQPYFWVIDALDECTDFTYFLPMLAKIDKKIPLRVLLTSRPSSVIHTLLLQERLSVLAKQVTAETSYEDIRSILEANARFLPIDNPIACENLIFEILDKSNGCFLWVTLVLKELETTHSEQQIQEVLDSVPSEMDSLYTRIMDTMAMIPRNKRLAQAILRWTVCAVRPLTVDELKEAIRLDLEEIIPRLERTVESVCGHLVYIDRNSRVQLVHQTVRAFLIQSGLDSDFAINRIKEHSRLAEVSLQYLCSDELKSSRFRRRGSATRSAKRSVFADYATVHFSEHIVRSSSSSDDQIIALNSFFDRNILTWIEIVAEGGDLYYLTQTAKNLKAYMERQAKHRSPLGQEVHAVSSWVKDLIYIVTTFGRSLLISPPSIHFLIPPVCPRNSIIYQTYHEYPRCLELVGQSEPEWDDRLSCINFSDCQVLAIACRDNRFVIGLSDGRVVLYHTSTCQEAGQMLHGTEAVRFLEFGSSNTLLATGGRQHVVVWDISVGTRLWAVDITHRLLAVGFNEDDTVLMGTTIANYTICWDVEGGGEIERFFVSDQVEDDSDTYRPAPSHAQISGELNLLAVCYRQRPINLWDLEDKSFIGQFHKSAPDVYPGPLLVAMVFNPNPDMNLIAASYQDGDLVVFDPWNQRQHAIAEANAHTLATSSDGATLATGDGGGTIQIFDFETLRLLYRSTINDFDIRAITFASNNVRFFDIRRDHCNVWEPSAIVRQTVTGDGSSEYCSEGVTGDAETVETQLWDDSQAITALISDGGDLLYCGKEDGSVDIYEAKTGQHKQQLYRHGVNAAIRLLEWNHRENVLVSIDRSSRFQVRKISMKTSGVWVAENPLLDQCLGQAIQQALLSPNGTILLVSTTSSDQLWSLEGHQLAFRNAGVRKSWQWVDCSSDTQRLLLAVDGQIHCFDWKTLDECPLPTSPQAPFGDGGFPTIVSMKVSSQGSTVCAHFRERLGNQNNAKLRFWSLSSSLSSSTSKSARDQTAKHSTSFDQIARDVNAVIGFYKLLLLFLDQSGWVCSINSEISGKEKAYTRHFFIPYGWHCNGELLFAVTAKGSIVLVRRDGIAVFHRGLDFEERVILSIEGDAAASKTKPHWRSPVLENHIDSPRPEQRWDSV